jgi:glyoxylate utilization-related uncharacterized protein
MKFMEYFKNKDKREFRIKWYKTMIERLEGDKNRKQILEDYKEKLKKEMIDSEERILANV